MAESNIEDKLDHKNLPVTSIKYLSDYRKRRYELEQGPKKQPIRIIIHEELATKVIMDCRTTVAHKFRARLAFKQNDVILTKEQSVVAKIKGSFEGQNMQTQYSMLGYRVDLYFRDYKLVAEIDENGHDDRNIDYEIKRQKTIEQERGFHFIRIDPGKEDFDIVKAINEILFTDNRLTHWLMSMKSLGLEFKSDTTIRSLL